MKTRLQHFILLLLLILPTTLAAATIYKQPSKTVPNKAHKNTQSLYSIIITSNGNELMRYEDKQGKKAYNSLQDEFFFELVPGQQFEVFACGSVEVMDIHIGFDWNGDGSFEKIYRAFAKFPENAPVTKENSSFNSSYQEYKDIDWRRGHQRLLGIRGVIAHKFTLTVPSDITIGKYCMRVLCDGEAYGEENGKNPPFDMNAEVGYAGSMHDFGVHITDKDKTKKPV